ncbi:MAG: UPF0280 family protein [Burkholderiaceae bacterium]
MNAAIRRPLPDGRWHFQHGPIDCVIGVDGESAAVAQAMEDAWARFQGVLSELVAELPMLRANLAGRGGQRHAVAGDRVDPGVRRDDKLGIAPQGSIARRMVAACGPYAEQGLFITAMAAVAGSVAQELIRHFERPGVRRAYVNNGGDIALHLAPGECFDVGLVIDPDRAVAGIEPGRSVAAIDGGFRVDAASRVRGVATSGWRGRSLSLGIADSVTVLAATAAQADAAATIVANAVDADDPRIARAPASAVRDDSDLGELLVTVDVSALEPDVVAAALAAGAACAERDIAAGRVFAVALCLQGRVQRCQAQVFHPSQLAATGPILDFARPPAVFA